MRLPWIRNARRLRRSLATAWVVGLQGCAPNPVARDAVTRPAPAPDGAAPSLAFGVGGASVPADANDLPTSSEALAPRWRFRAGSPTPGLALSRQGMVFVPTFEGHLQALGPDGNLRWAHNVHTPAVGAVATPDGGVVVGTQEGKLFSIRGDGSALFTVTLPFAPTTELVLDARGQVLFGDASGHVVSVNGFGAVRARWPAGGRLAAVPMPLASGGCAAVTTEGALVWLGAAAPRSVVLGPSAEGGPFDGPDGSLLALAAGELLIVRGETVIGRVPGVAAAVTTPSALVTVAPDGRLAFRNPDGEVEVEHRLSSTPSAPLAFDAGGVVYVPTRAGKLLVVTRREVRAVDVAPAALTRPWVDPERGQVVVAGGDGTVAAVPLIGESR